MKQRTMLQSNGSPPKLGGVAAQSRKCREASKCGADGVVPIPECVGKGTTRRFAPPLLTQEGSWLNNI